MVTRLKECLENKTGSYAAPFLWMHGEDKDRIKDELEKICDASIRTICLESRTHEIFGREKWFDDVRFIFDFCRENGMKAWILDDKHFPTGFANGAIENHPELLPWEIKSEYIDVSGPVNDGCLRTDFWLVEGTEILAAIACRHIPDTLIYDKAIDISSGLEDGRLYFDLPEGQWRICLLVRTRAGFSEHYSKYIDMLNPDSTQLMIDAVYQPHYDNLKEYFGDVFLGFFSDEPSFGNFTEFGFTSELGIENHHLPWRKNIYEKLCKFYGEETYKMFPCLWLSFNDGREKMFRIRYMDAITNEYSINFCKKMADWCHEHGVEYIGHVIEDNNTHYHTACGAGHYFRALRYQDMGGIDVVLHQIMPGINGVDNRGEVCYRVMDNKFFLYILAKLAASQANLDEHKKGRAMCEIFGAYGWAEGTKMMKFLLDHMLVRGINYFVPHAFSFKPDDDDCPPHFYAGGKNPEYRHFKLLMEYLDRVCHLLEGAVPQVVCSILFDAELCWANVEHTSMADIAKALYDNQIDYEIVPMEQLTDVNTDLIVAFDSKIKAREIYDKNTFFVSENNTPQNLLKHIYDRELWHITLSDKSPLLRYRKYIKDSAEIYLFSNEDIHNTARTKVTISGHERGTYLLYKPLENQIIHKQFDGAIPLEIEPYNMIILIFGDFDTSEFSFEKEYEIVNSADADLLYKISVAECGRDFRFYKETDKLFNVNKEPELRDFAGDVKYETEFLTESDCEIILDLGEVGEVAEVIVDGKSYGTKICPPYVFPLRGLQKGEHHLKIITTSHCGYRERDKFSRFVMMEPTGLLGPVKINKIK
ncbi:MAG: hypothetical protein IJF20_05450 [Clostridia bacterium]|nr:hypothetical protein [Clostridia bacterium]